MLLELWKMGLDEANVEGCILGCESGCKSVLQTQNCPGGCQTSCSDGCQYTVSGISAWDRWDEMGGI